MTTKSDLEKFAQTADRIRQRAIEENRLLDNPSDEQLRMLVEKQPGVRKTIYGNFVAESEPTSRAQALTRNSIDQPFGKEELEILALHSLQA